MIRRRFNPEPALTRIHDGLAELTGEVRGYQHEAVTVATARVAAAEQRVTAATAQAESRVAAVRAELHGVAHGQWLDHLRTLTAERDEWKAAHGRVTVERDAAVGQVDHLEAEVARLVIERDEARRQHDEQRAMAARLDEWKTEALEALAAWDKVYEAMGSPGQIGEWKSSNALAALGELEFRRIVAEEAVDALLGAARAVLPDLAHGLSSYPKGGSRSRAKARMEVFAALVEPDDGTETTNPQEAA